MRTPAGTDTLWTMITGTFFVTISYLMGGIDKLLVALAILMVVDYATGIMVGWFEQSVSSKRAYRGVAKKVAMLLFIIVGNQIDIIFGQDPGMLRYGILMLMIATEGISLSENFAKLGIPIPGFWTNALDTIRDKALNAGGGQSKENGKEDSK